MKRNSTILAILMLACLATAGSAQEAPDRSGFTMLLNVGVGFQRDEFFAVTETGVEGINLGLGAFVNEDMAIMFRTSGTTVSYDAGSQVSGVAGPVLQYWFNEKVNFEIGGGVGLWSFGDADDTALGLIFGVGYSIWNNAGHSLYVGGEYAPAFTDPATVHNFGIVFGWQLL